MQTQLPIKRALISVSNKTALVEFALNLAKCDIEILATGGTAELLKSKDIPVTDISTYTGFPEIMGGRVKTIHPKIAGGILARRGIDDSALTLHHISLIDLVIVNLYPFAETILQPKITLDQAIEQIDIGGPTMLRAAAKNSASVTTIVDPDDYELVLAEMNQHSNSTLSKTRLHLAQKVFAHTAQYDKLISNYLLQQSENKEQDFPENYQASFTRQEVLRYGENPHQRAALYREHNHNMPGTLTASTLLQGKQLSYNNMIDADCALSLVKELEKTSPACVIVKHATPTAAAKSKTLYDAYEKAHRADPQSAFGGIIAFNQAVDKTLAKKIITQQFLEILLAPHFDNSALEILKTKPNIRVLAYSNTKNPPNKTFSLHSISGGLLIQELDTYIVQPSELTIVTKRKPSDKELQDLLFSWQVVKFTKSNAIVFAKDGTTLGIGTGQTSRVFSAHIAAIRASAENLELTQAVMASDAFFPFADTIEYSATLGISAIIQPGGSVRDKEVIQAADKHDIAMVFTHIRHFRH